MPTSSPRTQRVLDWFEQIAAIPRCSKNEGQIREWLLDWSTKNSFSSKTDSAGNVLISVPATAGYEKSPTLIIQGHLDMVCEKTPDSTHDFSKDPIEFVYDGEWLTANKTTLGADNGIAIAIAMAMIMDESAEHPPLELLFTVDEETGLTGANKLETGFVSGKVLLNLDSEDEGVFTIGCAGGTDSDLSFPLDFENPPAGTSLYLLKAGGMKGGHSGVDIHEQRANAVKVLFRSIEYISKQAAVRLADVNGGSAHNAIPRDAEALLFIKEADFGKVKEELSVIEKTIKNEYASIEPDLALTLEPSDKSLPKAMTEESMKLAINAVLAVPHGVAYMATEIPGLVETSNNLATIKINNDALEILSSQRSSLLSRLDVITNQIHAVAHLSGGTAHRGEGYPPWEANWDSPLLKQCKEVYQRKFGKEPVVEVIHAGLECGIIGDRNPGMDMISFGPTIKNPHSPDERLKISDIDKIWDFLQELFREFK